MIIRLDEFILDTLFELRDDFNSECDHDTAERADGIDECGILSLHTCHGDHAWSMDGGERVWSVELGVDVAVAVDVDADVDVHMDDIRHQHPPTHGCKR